ncbi:hypothetical protein DPV79_36055 [Burkholderia reimsis]|uniref:Uncharacterized protein n=1 Tax=Burkholderia reimsis TaxID=2234132 RepID=A0A365QJ53_9BURK|nr:hypothetical protein DPV79_36055 [Burkholderia reimsis]
MMFEGLRIGARCAMWMGWFLGEIDVLAGFAVGCRMNSTRQGPVLRIAAAGMPFGCGEGRRG